MSNITPSYDSLDLIQQYATERLNLYRLAGQQHLTPPQMQRLDELNAQLPILWDQHRREVAAGYYPQAQSIEVLRPNFQRKTQHHNAA